jgi:protein phosphatase PTC7
LNKLQASRVAAARFLSVAAATDLTYTTTSHHVRRPYKFHIGCSYAGKPEDMAVRLKKVPFPEDTVIGGWRDKMLAWPKGVPFNTAGEDFFFVQEVRIVSISRDH